MKRIRSDSACIKRAQQRGERARIEARTRGGQCHVEGCRAPISYEHTSGDLHWLSCVEHQMGAPPGLD